ncbi:MAG: cbb3-type cytochrome c oxidase subunit II [Nitrospirota bacterium]|nr:cbb3-type cytochrome c oxidase subunit II [Nitrospirota bacterium]
MGGYKEYKIGVIMFLLIFGIAVFMTIGVGGVYLASVPATQLALEKQVMYGTSAWSVRDPLMKGWNTPQIEKRGKMIPNPVGVGKKIFIREGCWHCHTLLPEQSADWEYFGAPPLAGDFVGEAPTVVGSDRKAPDLMHVGSRMPSIPWHLQHHKDPRSVAPKSIMQSFDFLSTDELKSLAAYMVSLK